MTYTETLFGRLVLVYATHLIISDLITFLGNTSLRISWDFKAYVSQDTILNLNYLMKYREYTYHIYIYIYVLVCECITTTATKLN